MTERSHKGLVQREVTVKRGGKTFKQMRWVKPGDDEPVDTKSKEDDTKSKESYTVGDAIDFLGKELTIEKVSEKEKTVKLSNGKVYTFAVIKKGSEKKGNSKKKTVKDLKPKVEEKLKIKKEKINFSKLSNGIKAFESGLKFHPNGEKMIEAIEEYTATDYQLLNSYMRNELYSGNKEYDEKIEHISTFLNYAPKMEGVVFRGMQFPKDEKDSISKFNKFVNSAKVGESFMLNGFTSTSVDEKIAIDFSENKDNYGVIFEIKSKKGVYLNGLSLVPEENEVLFNKKTKFNIIKVNRTNPKNVRIIMEEI